MTQGTAGGGRPPTQAYVEKGKWVTDHLAPINATLFIGTGVLLPAMDFLRPYFPYISHVAVVLVLLFALVLALKLSGRRTGREMPTGFVVCAGVCAAAFGIGAVASERHAAQGGAVAAAMPWVAQQQRLLLDIRDGRSDDPRVELDRIGVRWDRQLMFEAARQGDLRVLELFLRGGMPVVLEAGSQSLPLTLVQTNYPRRREQLQLLQRHGVDLRSGDLLERRGGASPPTLYALAVREDNAAGAALLESLGAAHPDDLRWLREHPKLAPVVFPGLADHHGARAAEAMEMIDALRARAR